MIKVVEVTTFRESGEVKETTKTFPTWNAFKKALKTSSIATDVAYELVKHKEALIDYVDGQTVIKVIEEPAKSKIIGLDGRPFGEEP